MADIDKLWQDVSAAIASGKPGDVLLFQALWDDVQFIKQWVGHNFIGGAVRDHNHDGVNSAAIQIGSNAVRNGSFEDGLAGWTATQYSGGTVAGSTTGHMDGQKCVAITSTSITTGGGDLLSDEYIAVTGGELRLFLLAVKGSVAGIASKAEVIWYDEAKAQVSASQLYATADTRTTRRLCVRRIAAPAAARYCRIKLIGGTPTLGSATGTVYFDGVRVGDPAQLGGEQIFTASGTFSAIWGDVFVLAVGKGGDGWIGPDQNTVGAGGQGGGSAEGWTTISDDVAVTVSATVSSFGTAFTANAGYGYQGTANNGTATGGLARTGQTGSPNGPGGASRLGASGGDGVAGTYGSIPGVPGVVVVRW